VSVTVQRNDSPAADFYMAKQPWVTDAACLSVSPDIFFDDIDHVSPAAVRLKEARIAHAQSICAGCPVRMQCAEQVMLEEGEASEEHRYGFRAYMTPPQRVSVQRRGGLNGKDPMYLVNGIDGQRVVPGIPLEGDKWSRHHTTLARKVVRWVVDNVEIGGKLPTQTDLRAELGCKADPLRRVLRALVQDGTLDFAGKTTLDSTARYVRRGSPRAVAWWLPLHLRSASTQ
jgi:Transcription factor WhiB/Bacterial regulatory proteins, gntR family